LAKGLANQTVGPTSISRPALDDALAGSESRAVGRHKGVFAVAVFEGDERHVMIGGKRLHGGDKAVMSRLE
jgi:hypothetical protein